MKKFVKILLEIIALLIIAVILLWGKEIITISSVTQVGENSYLYEMDYSANYDLDEVLASNLDSNADLLGYVVGKFTKGLPIKLVPEKKAEAGEGFSCTSFQAKNVNGEGYLYGRNYDFFKNPSLVTHSHPKNGYASIAVSDMSHFGYSLEKLPSSFKNKLLSIAAIYAPVDGMNEKGLCTSIMALPKQAARQDTGKPIAGTTIIMRLFLDRCATVQEALDLLETVDIRHDATAGSGYHYMVADAGGNCAIIEFDLYDGWKTMIIRKPEDRNHLLITNHLLNPKYLTTEPDARFGNPNSHSWWRYETAQAYLTERNGTLNLEEAQECLSLVHWKDLVWPDGMVEDTQYSAVYDQAEKMLYLRNWNDYDNTVIFPL